MSAREGSDAAGAEAGLGAAGLGADLVAGSGESRQQNLDLHDARLCARVGCGVVAEHTLTADYAERIMAVGPLSPVRTPPALDLCARHRDALTPPSGWQLLRHDPERT